MKGKLGWLFGIGLWMISLVVVLGSLVLSLTQGGLLSPKNSGEPPLSATSAGQASGTETPAEMPPTAISTPSPTATATIVEPPTPTCAYPVGWILTTLSAETSLDDLARQFGLTPEKILQANCITAETQIANRVLYLPPATLSPTATHTEKPSKPKATQTTGGVQCGPPANWVIYVVQKGDTLYSIAVRSGTTIAELQWANCLGDSTTVRAGQKLFVPNLPQVKLPTATQKLPKPTQKPPKPTVPSGPGVTPIIITPIPTTSP